MEVNPFDNNNPLEGKNTVDEYYIYADKNANNVIENDNTKIIKNKNTSKEKQIAEDMDLEDYPTVTIKREESAFYNELGKIVGANGDDLLFYVQPIRVDTPSIGVKPWELQPANMPEED